MATLSFKPKQVTKRILSPLEDRYYDVIVNRFGLGDDAERKTLEAIGKVYGITRERVRQIENAALNAIKKSDAFKSEQSVFQELKTHMLSHGAVVPEEDFLGALSKDPLVQNHLYLYLVLGDDFRREKEDDHFKSRWTVDESLMQQVMTSLKNLYTSLSDEDLISEPDVVNRFLEHLKEVASEYRTEEIARRWLSISKTIAKNPLGDWGKAESSNIKTRGIRDYAFLMMRKHGNPMHFREVAKAICDTFDKKTHVATCHNELIKDDRFILVGRGVYALQEWGYKKGVVRDVIKDIIKKNGAMSKDDIVNQVMKERYLKKNTILVNLQNPKYFKKNKQGLYTIA